LPLSGAQRWLAPRAPNILAGLLTGFICASLAWQSLAWQRLLQAPTSNVSNASPATQEQPTARSLLPLFNSPEAANSNAPAPSTNLRLTLMGSFVHADPARSSAIIALEGSKAKRYAVGTQLSEGVLLHAVYRDHIELKRGGRIESLAFKRTPAMSSATQQYPNPNPPTPDYNAAQLQQFEEENGQQLRERMQALQQQMQASEPAVDAPTEQPTETD
jgi:general secretion pathway protein C